MSQYEGTVYSTFGNHSIDDPIKGSLEFIDRSYQVVLNDLVILENIFHALTIK